jgi:hypothetical protein
MTDAEIDNLWLEAFKASSDDGRVRQRFAELCYQKGAAETKRNPLADWEIYSLYSEPCSDAEMVEFARAIEAAHGIGQ